VEQPWNDWEQNISGAANTEPWPWPQLPALRFGLKTQRGTLDERRLRRLRPFEGE
jgi:hypothetical protein